MNRLENPSVSIVGMACALLCAVLCVACALLAPCPAWGAGEVITWDDSMSGPVGQPTGESDNTVTVTFNNNGTTNMDVYGSAHTPTPANNNSVTITGTGTITGEVNGASSQSDMLNNTLTVTGTTLNVVNGASSDKAVTAQNNTVTLTNVTVTAAGARQGSVNGATTAGLAKENTLTITGSDIQGWLTGGNGGGTQGKAEGNTLHIIDSTVFNAFAGQGIISASGNKLIFEGNSEATSTVIAGEGNKTSGIFDLGSATDNTLTIRGGTVRGEAFGGLAGLNAERNRVEVEGGTLGDYLHGGKSTTADATGNTVKISGGTLTNVYGGYARNAAKGNEIEFSGGAASARSLIGGLSTTADATNNVVRMSGGTATFEVHGGRGVTGVADNLVELSGGTVKEGVYGGTNRGAGSALRNTVIVSGTAKAEKGVSGGISDGGTVENNKVVVSGNADAGSVVGGFASNHDAKNNIVEMSGGSAQFLVGGDSNSAQATGNVVRMTGGTVRRDVRGAQGDAGVIDNLVDLSGGTVQGHVEGGKNRRAGSALRNTVILSQNIIVQGKVYGGNSEGLGVNGGTAESNAVTMSGNARVDGDVVGGISSEHAAKSNTVEMTGGSAKSLTGGQSGIAGANSNGVKMTSGTVSADVRGGAGVTEATDNSVDLSGGTVQGHVYGGQNTGTGSALRNTVVLADAMVAEKSVYGAHNTGGVAEENAVGLSGTVRVGESVVGGFSQTHAVRGNGVEMKGGTVGGYVAGGESAVDAAANNWVNVQGGSVGGSLIGGSAATSATGNTVQMSGGSVTGDVRGGLGVTGAENNTVALFGGAITGMVYGGQSTDAAAGSAKTNKVFLSNAMVAPQDVYGGHSAGGSAEGNSVGISDTASVAGRVVGGFSLVDLATDNAVSMSGGSVAGTVTGGQSAAMDAKDNAVQMSGGSVTGMLTGGQSDVAQATGNTVLMEGGAVNADVRGGAGVTGVADNAVAVSGGDIAGSVYGGQNTGTGSAKDNTVSLGAALSRAPATPLTIGQNVYGGHSSGGTAEGNTVGVSGATEVRGAVVGGFSQGDAATGNTVEMMGGTVHGYMAGGESGTGAATGNTVNIHGGVTGMAVYGGYTTGPGNATGNTLNLYGSPDLSASTLYGGLGGGDARSDNTLNVFTSGLTAKNVANFAKYNFILPDYVRPGHTVLTLTDSAPTLVGNADVGVGKVGGGMLMQPGDRIFLLHNEGGGVQAEGMKSHNIRGQHGVSVEYDFSVRATDTTVEIYLDPVNDPVRIRPETKVLAEAYVATLALINQGAELATKSAVAAAGARTEDPWGVHVFGTVAGGSARYNTGSHVDLSGTNMVAGVSKALPVQDVRVLLGAFVEAGFARYQTYNGFSGRPSVTAGGNNRYMGGGLLAHATQMVKDSGGKMRQRGPYVEASVRAGRMDMDFASKDLRDMTGREASYTASAPYFGAHVGTGYVWDLSESTTAEVYGQVHWTHLKGDKFRVLGDPVTVDDANSWRLRAGARVTHAWNDRISGYVGAAYEHSFDGKIKARAYNMRIPSPELQGGSGLAEAGLRITPSGGAGGFSADINVNGSVGHKQSLGGEVTLQYEF